MPEPTFGAKLVEKVIIAAVGAIVGGGGALSVFKVDEDRVRELVENRLVSEQRVRELVRMELPVVRPDPFTGTDAARLEARIREILMFEVNERERIDAQHAVDITDFESRLRVLERHPSNQQSRSP